GPVRWRWPSRPDLGERWPSRLVATAAESRLNIRLNLHTSFAAASDCRNNRDLRARVARRFAPTFPVQMYPLTQRSTLGSVGAPQAFARPRHFCGATARQSKPRPHKATTWAWMVNSVRNPWRFGASIN